MHPAGRLQGWFSRTIGFPLIVNGAWRRDKNRPRFRAMLREKLEFHRLPPERQRALQLERLRALLTHAGLRVPYYRRAFAAIGFDPAAIRSLEDIHALPLLTREAIRENSRDLTSDDAASRFPIESATGGSTGSPVHFRIDAETRDNGEAAAWVGDMAAGRRMGSRTALLWGSDRDAHLASGIRGTAYSLLRNEWWYNSFDMSPARMRRYDAAMRRHPPDVILAYASSADIFARFLEAGGRRPEYPTTSIITSAEVLHDDARATLTRVFGRPVFDRYGSREIGIIAFECEAHAGLHINTADLIVECPCGDPAGSPGEIVITQLNNRTMPFIRYRIEDMAVLASGDCPCGRRSPRIARVFGRTSDTIVTSSGRLIHGEFFTHLFYGVRGIARFQFVQEEVDHYRLVIVRGEGFDRDSLDPIAARISAAVGDASALAIEFVNEIPPSKSGKYLFTVSRVPVRFPSRPRIQ